MRKLLLTVLLFINYVFVFTEGSEKVCVATSGAPKCAAQDLGPVSPCQKIPFIAQSVVPPIGFAIAAKLEWDVNGLFEKTSTDAADLGLDWITQPATKKHRLL
jgi:hypothetical protein